MSDQVNSSRLITDSTGDVVYSAGYEPFGAKMTTWIDTYDPQLKFSGKERESYTNLDYFGARYYDNLSYRFLSPDPVITKDEALSNPQLWNLYAYCRNNPTTYLDPDGRNILESIKNWWNDAPIGHFVKGDFAGGLNRLIDHLHEQMNDPTFILGFSGGIKTKSSFPYPFINKKGIMQWKDPKTGKFASPLFKLPDGVKLPKLCPLDKLKSGTQDLTSEYYKMRDLLGFYETIKDSIQANDLLSALENVIKAGIKKE